MPAAWTWLRWAYSGTWQAPADWFHMILPPARQQYERNDVHYETNQEPDFKWHTCSCNICSQVSSIPSKTFSRSHIFFSQLWALNITKNSLSTSNGTRFSSRTGSREQMVIHSWWHVLAFMALLPSLLRPALFGHAPAFHNEFTNSPLNSRCSSCLSSCSVSALTHSFRMRTSTPTYTHKPESRLIDKNVFFFTFQQICDYIFVQFMLSFQISEAHDPLENRIEWNTTEQFSIKNESPTCLWALIMFETTSAW